MALETGTYISDLVVTNPVGSTDQRRTLDDHIRLLKSTIKTTFPNVTGAVTSTHTELNYVDGVTSSIQDQIDTLTADKADIAGETYSGTHDFTAGAAKVPTKAVGTNTTDAASCAFVVATSLNATLPGQTNHSGEAIFTDGATASWSSIINAQTFFLAGF
ncbi:hypothetical protein [Herbaspirillum sp. ST 5-3]|uniref:hypothetical protein n=1 Tax=Oxalobacteraceae TaxID=75682 RepID=UPI0010A30447|nr:hypothetical protein [Herbaspirillum sp. ST 5-3]